MQHDIIDVDYDQISNGSIPGGIGSMHMPLLVPVWWQLLPSSAVGRLFPPLLVSFHPNLHGYLPQTMQTLTSMSNNYRPKIDRDNL